jgi:hypothetical protein
MIEVFESEETSSLTAGLARRRLRTLKLLPDLSLLCNLVVVE